MRLQHYLLFTILAAGSSVESAEPKSELDRFQGNWQVVELSENGRVIPREAIGEWLPSGGRLTISENAIISTSPHDGQKSVKLFSVDATQYPRGIDLVTRDKSPVKGIYRFDEDRLVICLGDPDDGPRPTEFSAPADSRRMLLVLKQTSGPGAEHKPAVEPAPVPKTADTNIAAKVLTDDEASRLLI